MGQWEGLGVIATVTVIPFSGTGQTGGDGSGGGLGPVKPEGDPPKPLPPPKNCPFGWKPSATGAMAGGVTMTTVEYLQALLAAAVAGAGTGAETGGEVGSAGGAEGAGIGLALGAVVGAIFGGVLTASGCVAG